MSSEFNSQGVAKGEALQKELRKNISFENVADKEKESLFAKFSAQEKRELEWYDDTCSLEKINDTELFYATGYDPRFINIHHKVRELLEADYELGKDRKVRKLGQRRILESLKSGADGKKDGIRVNEIDSSGELTGVQVDLYNYVHLKKIKEFYLLLDPGDRGLPGNPSTLEELEKKFYQSDPIEMKFRLRNRNGEILKDNENKEKMVTIKDLRTHIAKPTVTQEEFDYYYKSIKESQTSLQYLSTLRDISISGHHAENSGHAQLGEGVNGELLYLPVSAKMAADYTRGDVAKTSPRHRAGGHPHEIGFYEENTAACVKLEAAAMRLWRGEITDYQTHRETFNRTLLNSMGLGSGEEPLVDKKETKMWFGKRKLPDGKEKRMKIYDAMHYHYDTLLKEKRGYALTDQEAGDKLVTDVLAVCFAVNPRDFLMTFGKASGFYDPRDITSSQMLKKEDEKGKPILVFYAKYPNDIKKENDVAVVEKKQTFKTADSTNYGEIEIHGFTALAKYFQWRVKLGDVPGIDKETTLDLDFVDKLSEKRDKRKLEME